MKEGSREKRHKIAKGRMRKKRNTFQKSKENFKRKKRDFDGHKKKKINIYRRDVLGTQRDSLEFKIVLRRNEEVIHSICMNRLNFRESEKRRERVLECMSSNTVLQNT